jgi:hypothetical protein
MMEAKPDVWFRKTFRGLALLRLFSLLLISLLFYCFLLLLSLFFSSLFLFSFLTIKKRYTDIMEAKPDVWFRKTFRGLALLRLFSLPLISLLFYYLLLFCFLLLLSLFFSFSLVLFSFLTKKKDTQI